MESLVSCVQTGMQSATVSAENTTEKRRAVGESLIGEFTFFYLYREISLNIVIFFRFIENTFPREVSYIIVINKILRIQNMQVKCTFCKVTIQRTDMFSKCRCKLDMFGNIIRSWCEETNAKFRIHFRPTIYNVLASTLLLSSVILNIFTRRFNRFSFIHESTVRRFAKNTVVSEMTQLAVSSLRKNCSILLKTTNPRTKATIEAS